MWEDVFKPILIFIAWIVGLGVPLAAMGSCIDKGNQEQRARQMQECKARGGTYSRSFEPNASPYRDSCVT